jgi:hypothetical protein
MPSVTPPIVATSLPWYSLTSAPFDQWPPVASKKAFIWEHIMPNLRGKQTQRAAEGLNYTLLHATIEAPAVLFIAKANLPRRPQQESTAHLLSAGTKAAGTAA